MPTAKDIELLRSKNKKVRIKVKLLDSITYQEVDNITGNIVSCSLERDYGSDIRSTCALTLSVPKKDAINTDFDKVWNKRMVELLCGIYDKAESKYVEYALGRMLMVSGSTMYSGDSQEIKLNLVDLMASLTEERGSQIGTDTFIPTTAEGVNVRDVIVNIIGTFAEYKRYNICEFDSTLPHDLRFEVGIYPIEMLNEIISLFPYYEMFYDEEGIFTVQKIPTKVSDPVDIGPDILDDLIISESRNSNFSVIRNTTEIWGRTLECDYAAISCETVGSTYNVTINESFTTMTPGESYAVKPTTDSVAGQKMKIQNLPEYGIYTMNGAGEYSAIQAGEMLADTVYAIRFTEEKFVLQGEMQIRCIVQEITEAPSIEAKSAYMEENACWNVQWVINPDSQYGCTITPTTGRITGEIKQVLQDGEYEGIYTTQLAFERAKYENWKKCRLQDSIEVEMILVPWMKINQKIQYTSPVSGEVGTWIVQAISYDFKTWTMTVRASRFYPYYPWDNGEEED